MFCDDILEEKSIQVKWPIINNNEKQNENLLALQQLKNFDNENDIPSPLIINNNQAYLIDNFHLIKQRYSSLADFNLSRGMRFSFVSTFILFLYSDGKQLRITFKPHNIFVVFETIVNSRNGESWKSKII